MVAVEGGMELIHQRTGSLRLRAELAGLARLPLANTRMVEAVAGLPVLLFYRLGPRVELFVSNLLGYERARTPPLFVPEDLALASPGKPILYDALHEALRSAVSLEPVRIVRLELGAYARAKTVTFYASDEEAGQDEEIADYWLYDLGLDLGATVQISPSFSARLRYDLAHRGFPGEGNLPARKSNFLPVGSGTNLTMLRQLAGLYLRGRVADLISARVSYGVRLVHDNGGYYECTDHLVGLGMEASWPDLLNITMGATLLLRNYTRRDVKGYSSSKPTSEGDMSVQIQEELSLVGHLRGELTVTEWLQVVLLYEV